MSRLDRHIGMVRNKLALTRFLQALSAAVAIALTVYALALLGERLSLFVLPRDRWLLIVGVGVPIVFATLWAIVHRPGRQQAAVLIDERLKLHEKFSTALFIRNNPDPFAKAAVQDAERTAENVQPQSHFPVQAPARNLTCAGAALVVALLISWLMPTFDPFSVQEAAKKKALHAAAVTQAQEQIQKAMAEVNTLPKSVADTEDFKALKAELDKLNDPKAIAMDPAKAERIAKKAMDDAKASDNRTAEDIKRVAIANNSFVAGKMQPTEDKGLVPEAQNHMVQGDFAKASDDLEQVAEDFTNKSKEEQQKTQEQMDKLADQLANAANDPATQQQMQQQLQQAGATAQQAQQMSSLMQQAANGNAGAQQQLQQMANQIAQQVAKNGQPTPAQQQQIAAAMQAAQSMTNQQSNANTMSQAAKQMAKAMAQAQAAAAQQGGQSGQGGQTPQQAAAQAQAMANAQAAMQQAAGAMSAAGQAQQLQQAQAQAAGQQGGQQGQQGGQQGAQGQQGQGGQQGAQAQAGGQQGGQGQPGGQGQGEQLGQNEAGGQGQYAQGDPNNNQGNGQGGPGVGNGGHMGKEMVPYATKAELSPSQENEKGIILASTLIKDNHPDKGASTEALKDVAVSAEKDLTDEVNTEHVNREEQDAAKKYFATMKEDDNNK